MLCYIWEFRLRCRHSRHTSYIPETGRQPNSLGSKLTDFRKVNIVNWTYRCPPSPETRTSTPLATTRVRLSAFFCNFSDGFDTHCISDQASNCLSKFYLSRNGIPTLTPTATQLDVSRRIEAWQLGRSPHSQIILCQTSNHTFATVRPFLAG